MKRNFISMFTVNALMTVALLLTACGGKDGGKNWDEQIDGTFAANGLIYEAQLTDTPESPLYSAKKVFGYWKGAIDGTLIVLYQDNSYRYSMVVYEVGEKVFQEAHEIVQGERNGIPVFYDKQYDKYYVWNMQEGNALEHRSKEDINVVVETYTPVVWRTEESMKAAGIAAIATRKGFGPIELGSPFGGFPDSVEGLYDSCESYEEVHEGNSDSEGYEGDEFISTWTEKYWRFSKEGKEIFRVYVERAKITRYVLLEGSKHIQTVDGIYAGMPIRELYEHKPDLAWESDELSGDFTAWNNNFVYGVQSSDIAEGKFPQSADDFKADAVLRSIDCSYQ